MKNKAEMRSGSVVGLWLVAFGFFAALMPIVDSNHLMAQAVMFSKHKIEPGSLESSPVDTYLYLRTSPLKSREESVIFSVQYSVNEEKSKVYAGDKLLSILESARKGDVYVGTNTSSNELEYITVYKETEATFRLPLDVKQEEINKINIRLRVYVSAKKLGVFSLSPEEKKSGSDIFTNLSDKNYQEKDSGHVEIWEIELKKSDVRNLLEGTLKKAEGEVKRG